MKKQIPNLFTLLNPVFGCMAIVAIMQNGLVVQYNAEGAQIVSIPEKIWLGSLFIFLAAVVDFLDGFLARKLGASSEMGLQLDSLADVVSFGVAPSMIIYQFLRLAFASDENGLNISSAWLFPAFILAAAGAYRLARYNITHNEQTKNFIGVPIPAMGLVVASFPLIYWFSGSEMVVNVLLNKWFLYILIAALSYLLVCKIPMLNLKFEGISFANNKSRYILLIVGVICAALLQWLAVPIIFLVYIILSLAFLKKKL